MLKSFALRKFLGNPLNVLPFPPIQTLRKRKHSTHRLCPCFLQALGKGSLCASRVPHELSSFLKLFPRRRSLRHQRYYWRPQEAPIQRYRHVGKSHRPDRRLSHILKFLNCVNGSVRISRNSLKKTHIHNSYVETYFRYPYGCIVYIIQDSYSKDLLKDNCTEILDNVKLTSPNSTHRKSAK